MSQTSALPLAADPTPCPGTTGRTAACTPTWPVGVLGGTGDHVLPIEAVIRIGAMNATRQPPAVGTANVSILAQARSGLGPPHVLPEVDPVSRDAIRRARQRRRTTEESRRAPVLADALRPVRPFPPDRPETASFPPPKLPTVL